MQEIIDKNILDSKIIGRYEPRIYAFSTNTIPNHLKIGDTYRPVDERLKEWKDVYPHLEKRFEEKATINDKLFFRDYSVHQYLENNLSKERINPLNFPNEKYISLEFFKDTEIKDIEDAIDDIKKNPTNYRLYNASDLSVYRTIFARNKNYQPRDNQKEVINRFKSVYKTRKNLLMYAVMRFGKSFTAMCCAKEMNAKIVLIVSAKKDVELEWKQTVEEHMLFEGYEFLTKEDLRLSPSEIKKRLKNNGKVVLFFTLQDLQKKKDIHKELFENKIDLMIIDESHFGARARKYGKIIKEAKSTDDNDDDSLSLDKAIQQINNIEKYLKIDVKLHLSGTPYRILLSDEFENDDIIARVSFSDIIDSQKAWDKEHLNKEEKYEEWDNPYYGFPQMIRFAFTPSKKARKLLCDLEKSGMSSNLSELLKPVSTKKYKNDYKKFIHEDEVLELLEVIDGSKTDENILGFLNYDKIKEGNMCRHIVMVLPYKASCDAMEQLLIKNKRKFKNLNEYQILNIAGLNQSKKFKKTLYVKNKIEDCEKKNKKTITLTVNRMLTGSTIKEWDTMIYLKGTSSPQEYDQAIFRLQNQFIKNMVEINGNSENGKIIKYNMKPQTILVDFDPDRMFILEEEKAFVSNTSEALRGNDILKEKLDKGLEISPIIRMNKNKIHIVEPKEIMDFIRDYSKERGVMDEVYNIPVDFRLMEIDEIKELIDKQGELGSRNPFQTKYGFGDDGEGDNYDFDVEPDSGDSGSKNQKEDSESKKENNQEKTIELKFKTYYTRLLFYSVLSKSNVNTIKDIIDSADNEDNKRILLNLGININTLKVIKNNINPDILKRLEYRISAIHQLSCDDSLTPLERATVALNKFDRISDAEVMTSQNTCLDMLKTIGKSYIINSIKQKKKILDIASKKAEFILAIVKMLQENGFTVDEYKDLLYAIPTSKIAYEFTRKMYEILGLNIMNISYNTTSYDMLKIKNGDEVDYDKIVSFIKKCKSFKELELDDNLFNLEGDEKMNFDIIVGNPPYQEDDGGAGASAKPIYNHFVNISKKLNPKYLSLIIPTRWYVGGKGLDEFRRNMVNDSTIKEIHDCLTPDDIFPNTNNRGGVCYLLWDREYDNNSKMVKVVSHCNNKIIDSVQRPLKIIDDDIFIRDYNSKTILEKVMNKHFSSFENIVSSRKPFGLDGNYAKANKNSTRKSNSKNLKCFIKGMNSIYVSSKDIQTHKEWIDKWKVFIPRANNIGTELNDDNMNSFVGEPNNICTESYLVVGADLSLNKDSASNLSKYLQTKFLRYLHMLLKSSQDATSKTFSFVPIQDFSNNSDIDWSKSINEIDKQLYSKYNLTKNESEYIESKIKEMN